MRGNKKSYRVTGFVLTVIMAVSLLAAGCSYEDATVDSFVSKRRPKELDYWLLNNEELIFDLTTGYTGKDDPEPKPMDEEEFINIWKKLREEKEEEEASTSETAEEADTGDTAEQTQQADTGDTSEEADTGDTSEEADTGESSEEADTSGNAEEEKEPDYPVINTYEEFRDRLHEAITNVDDSCAFYTTEVDNDTMLAWMQPALDEIKSTDFLNNAGGELDVFSVGIYGGKGVFSITWRRDRETIQREREEADAEARRVADMIGSGGSEYDIVYKVNQYLIDTDEYAPKDSSVPGGVPYKSHCAYAGLVSHEPCCEGYAFAAGLILQKLGIECMSECGDVIENDGSVGGGHAWNLVKVDGNWYQLDICWNDVCGRYDAENGCLTYFLVDDDFMSGTRVWERDKYPACDSGTY